MSLEADLEYLVGSAPGPFRPLEPYAPPVVEFLGALSQELRGDGAISALPDVASFAFWCRRAHLEKLKADFGRANEGRSRLGLGRVFHITPSNVPVNFGFSYVFGLLAGNANVVRVPSKATPQTDLICAAVRAVAARGEFAEIGAMTAFVRYPHDDSITGAFSAACNARIIWGGDAAIQTLRRIPIPERAVEIAFADRYSLCAIHAPSVLALDDAGLRRLADGFYNDTFLMDQNACSSPHLILWLGGDPGAAQERFWSAVAAAAERRYPLPEVRSVDKYQKLCEDAIDRPCVSGITRHGNWVYRAALRSLPDSLDGLRGRFGYFYEHAIDDLGRIAPAVDPRYQTLTYFGLDKEALREFAVTSRLMGIDRIVPIGSALDIGVVWDGYDIVGSLSRIIDVR